MATKDPFIMGHRFGVDLCAALGVQKEGVRSITVAVEVGQPVIVTVESYVKDSAGKRLAELVSNRFKLVEAD